MFFFLKIKHPLYRPKTQAPFYSTIPSLSLLIYKAHPIRPRPLTGPEPDPLARYMANLPLNSWQFYHFFSGYAATSKLKPTCLHPLDIRHSYAIIITHPPIAEKQS